MINSSVGEKLKGQRDDHRTDEYNKSKYDYYNQINSIRTPRKSSTRR